MPEWILEVSDLNEYVRATLNADPALRSVRLRGEISNFKRHSSGHWYFTLKDDRCRISAVMFRQNAMRMSIRPMDGMRVIVSGQVSLYPESGTYQVYCDNMRPDGVGTLYQQFEALKQKLQLEGLFDQARKRPLPWRPRKIAVVTSETGAVLHDIRKVSAQRDPGVPLVLLPVQVQGIGAAEDIATAIRRAGKVPGVNVIITGRGGGSMEDLWAFNEEIVARAIVASPIPVVSCVGHEVDFTISDFVADLRAPTPSAAAELTVPLLDQLRADMDGMVARLAGALRSGQRVRRLALERLGASPALTSPEKTMIEPRRARLEGVERRLSAAMPVRLERCWHRLEALSASLRALDPASVMERGYAVVRQDDRVVSRAAQAAGALPLRVCFADGELLADITAMRAKEENR